MGRNRVHKVFLFALFWLCGAPSPVAAKPSRPAVMATLPAGAVPGVGEALVVTEDLALPDAPIVYTGKTLLFRVTKSGELQASLFLAEISVSHR